MIARTNRTNRSAVSRRFIKEKFIYELLIIYAFTYIYTNIYTFMKYFSFSSVWQKSDYANMYYFKISKVSMFSFLNLFRIMQINGKAKRHFGKIFIVFFFHFKIFFYYFTFRILSLHIVSVLILYCYSTFHYLLAEC